MNEKPITAFHNYPTAALFCLTSAFWLMIATFMGILLATLLIAPDLTEGIGWLTFGRIRPVHVNLVLFGFVTPGLLSAAFYYIPKLLRTDLYSEKLGIISACAWNLAMVATVVTLLAGHTQAREYAELIWSLDMLVILCYTYSILIPPKIVTFKIKFVRFHSQTLYHTQF